MTYATGKIGQAFNFNGTNAYVSLPDDSLNFTNQFSYSFWIKSSDTTNYGVVVGNVQSPRSSYSTFHGYEIGMDSGKFFLFFRNGYGNQYIYYTTNIVNNGNWNHIVVTYDPPTQLQVLKYMLMEHLIGKALHSIQLVILHL